MLAREILRASHAGVPPPAPSIHTGCKAVPTPKPTSTTVRIVSQKEQATLSKAQKAFNKLTEKIARQRNALAAWQEMIPLYQQKVDSKFRPFLTSFNQRREELVYALDKAYDEMPLSKTAKSTISALICNIAAQLMDKQGNEALKQLHDRHSDIDFDAKAEMENRAFKSMVETMLDIDLGDDLDLSSRANLFAEVDDQIRQRLLQDEEDEQAEEARRSKRKKSARETEKEARLQAEEQNVSQSIREVFRKLASALHPDREQDPAEQQRKTALMQKVNVAYGNRDLLQLLELQLELEQIDQKAMNAVSENRLKHYNKVLAEQSAELQQEIDMVASSFNAKYQLPPGYALSPAKVMSFLQSDIRQIQEDIATLKREIAACKDIKTLKQLLKSYQNSRESLFEDDFAG